ncbi:NAD(P)H-binding protein [Asanoa sp. NPDC049518]|uniref:NAD(P)H-binding protein n=1 Tax=unclassified Asanoa TaxID=2685164 RepID=UPI003444B783
MTILVTGGTGNIGRHLVDHLHRGGTPFRVMARRPSDVLPPGTAFHQGDLTDPPSLAAALSDGVDRVFLLWPSLSPHGIQGVVAALRQAEVRHVVYVSAMQVTDDNRRTIGVWGSVEQAVVDAGLGHTFLRVSGLATNTLGWAPAIRAGEPVRIPYPMAKRSLIHEADIAAVAAVALTDSGHTARSHVLTGPGVISQAEQVAAIAAATGRPVNYVDQDPGEARAAIAEWAEPEWADQALAYWASLVDHPEPVTRTVEEVLGRPARSFGQWAADHAGDFTAPA